MKTIQSDCFNKLINDDVDLESINKNVVDFKIYRNNDLEIMCNITEVFSDKENPNSEAVGIKNFKLKSGISVTIKEIFTVSRNMEISCIQGTTTVYAQYMISEILCTKSEDNVEYLIEWLANVSSYYMFPTNAKESDASNVIQQFFIKSKKSPEFINARSTNRVYLSIDGYDLCFGYIKDDIKDIRNRGFILYKNFPPANVREKIRISLSFIFGLPLIYLSEIAFDENLNKLFIKAVTAYSNRGLYLKTSILPPTLLSDNIHNEIESTIFSQRVNSVYENFEKLDFKHISSLYWHAVSASHHYSAGLFGSAIEQLCDKYKNKGFTNFLSTVNPHPN